MSQVIASRRSATPESTAVSPFTIEPCRDALEGGQKRSLYEAVGLPTEWIDRRVGVYGAVSPKEYFWTEDAAFKYWGATPELLAEIRARTGGCFFNLGLAAQCELLGIQTQAISKKTLMQFPGECVEERALAWYRSEGWVGDRSEGAFFHHVSGFCYRRFEERFDTYMTAPFPHSVAFRKKLAWLPTMFSDTTLNDLQRAKTMLGAFKDAGTVRANIPAYFDSIGKGEIDRLVARIADGFFVGRGWPDLTLVHPGTKQFQLVEVKQKGDSFTLRQATWLRNFWRPLRWPFYVLRVE